MVYTCFNDLVQKVKEDPQKRRLIAVAANDRHCIEAVVEARDGGLIEPVLIGDAARMKEILAELGTAIDEMYDIPDVDAAAAFAVQLVNEGRGDIILKGKLETKEILRPVVNRETGLSNGNTMSFIAINEVPWYHKLIFITDGGMMTYPTVEQKRDEINNAVRAMRNMGYTKPKVAVLAAVEVVNPKMPETVDGALLKQMNQKGEIPDCIVEGPISFDIALREESARVKGFVSEVAGDADLLVVPNIHCGNMLGKCMVESGGKMVGLVLGAKAPILLTSRAASAEEKYLSIALAAFAARGSE